MRRLRLSLNRNNDRLRLASSGGFSRFGSGGDESGNGAFSHHMFSNWSIILRPVSIVEHFSSIHKLKWKLWLAIFWIDLDSFVLATALLGQKKRKHVRPPNPKASRNIVKDQNAPSHGV